MLRTHKKLPYPADHWTHDFQAIISLEKCIGCGICEKRCNVNAVRVVEKKAIVDLTRCIGCGLCVVTCNQNAIELVPVENPKNIPKTYDELYESIYQNKRSWIQKILTGIRMKLGKRWHRD
jgi:MinD superfamily P-loop ATPase